MPAGILHHGERAVAGQLAEAFGEGRRLAAVIDAIGQPHSADAVFHQAIECGFDCGERLLAIGCERLRFECGRG